MAAAVAPTDVQKMEFRRDDSRRSLSRHGGNGHAYRWTSGKFWDPKP